MNTKKLHKTTKYLASIEPIGGSKKSEDKLLLREKVFRPWLTYQLTNNFLHRIFKPPNLQN